MSKVVVTIGDEAGIGPEVLLKALNYKEFTYKDFIIFGSKRILNETYKNLDSKGIKNLVNPDNLDIKDLEIKNKYSDQPGADSGHSSFLYLDNAIDLVKKLPNSALVTGPICKKSWALAGHYYSGQTELLAEKCNASNFGMLFTAKSPLTGWRFNTLLASTHIPLNKVSSYLNKSLIHSKLDLLSNFCKRYNSKPYLKVAGINPHAGEEGILGIEEKNWLCEAIAEWSAFNSEVTLEGPISPDSCWVSSAKSWKTEGLINHDGILAMYHDQGLIPMKVIASNYSVNTTIGLPFVRTSPDHGTGFDIAGKGIAQSQSMIEALKTARELSNNSSFLDSH